LLASSGANRASPCGSLGYGAVMVEGEAPIVEGLHVTGPDEPETVVVYASLPRAIAHAAGSASALAVVALITATATIFNVAAAADIAESKLVTVRAFNELDEIRWVSGTRLVVAGIALLIAIVAGSRYTRGLPSTQYTFTADGEEANESVEGVDAPGWITMLVGAAVTISVLAIVLNGIAFAMTFHLHQSPNFGSTGG
jgi:hypothetical protein